MAAMLGAIILFKSIGREGNWICQNGQWVKHGNPSAAQPTSGCGAITPSPSASQTSQSPQASPEKNITLKSPSSGEAVILPIQVSGTGRVFESVVSVRLKEPSGAILYEGITMTNAPDAGQFGDFQKNIDYLIKKPAGSDIILDVFWNSPMDGSELDLISVPLKINLSNTSIVKAYFGNSQTVNDCNKVVALDRVIKKITDIARKTVEVLLQGLSLSENQKGYTNSINPDVKINSLSVFGGTAKIDFNEELQREIGGSCRVATIRAQITETLKQFSSIKEVVISINGRTEDILQP